MSFSSVQRFSPIARTLLPALPVRSIAYESSKLCELMKKGFTNGQFAPFIAEWEASKTEKWDGNSTTLHKLAKGMPKDVKVISNFRLFAEGNSESKPHYADLIYGMQNYQRLYISSEIKDDEGNTPLRIAIQEKNWPLALYLRKFDRELGLDLAVLYLKNVEFQPFSEQGLPNLKGSIESEMVKYFVEWRVPFEEWKTQDENGWTLTHWLAFKGFSKEDLRSDLQYLWERDKDHKGFSPARIAEFIRYLSNESIEHDPEMEKHFLPNMPAARAKELMDAIVLRKSNLVKKMDRALSVLPDGMRSSEYRELSTHSASRW